MAAGEGVPVISASEIAEYSYCAASWHFERNGRSTTSPSIERGNLKHAEVGRTLTTVEQERQIFWLLTILGYGLLALALIILLWGLMRSTI
ncbi:hypothetical protein Metli_2164 [Methanofollis liminatans DSM 4140]|jgi:hypothetical protein|uniref:Uncharacterized protein n=1 Tax=Methanofollis liminatans DSM 4140 TaxID=28892 RepID=J1L5L9_9EURY|nr:hypothetical protein [Methanofollis liminatans]EJG08105.1 hypothetical protein Metli_2164 [Methanofollis liminatans DSM 4140]